VENINMISKDPSNDNGVEKRYPQSTGMWTTVIHRSGFVDNPGVNGG
jgi:hypothetical protein